MDAQGPKKHSFPRCSLKPSKGQTSRVGGLDLGGRQPIENPWTKSVLPDMRFEVSLE